MHDIRAIRENPEAFDAAMARRGLAAWQQKFWPWTRRGAPGSPPPKPRRPSGTPPPKRSDAPRPAGDEAEFQRLRDLVAAKKDERARLEDEARAEDARLRDYLMGLPNLPLPEMPDGADEDDNVEMHRRGTPPDFGFRREGALRAPGHSGRHGFRDGGQAVGQSLRGADGRRRARAPGAGAVHAGHTRHRERPDRDLDAGAGARGDDAGHRPAAQVRRGQLSDARRLVADPHRRGDADQHRQRLHRRARPTCRAASSPIPSASAPRPAARAATPPACCASTSSRRSRWSRSSIPTAGWRSTTA